MLKSNFFAFLFAAAALLFAGCQETNQSALTPEYSMPQAADLGRWSGEAVYFFEMRDLPAAEAQIDKFVADQNSQVIYRSEQESQYIMRFPISREEYDKIGGKLLQNSDLTYFSFTEYDAEPDTPVLLTVVMQRSHIPGPLYIALWLPAKILEKMVYLD